MPPATMPIARARDSARLSFLSRDPAAGSMSADGDHRSPRLFLPHKQREVQRTHARGHREYSEKTGPNGSLVIPNHCPSLHASSFVFTSTTAKPRRRSHGFLYRIGPRLRSQISCRQSCAGYISVLESTRDDHASPGDLYSVLIQEHWRAR